MLRLLLISLGRAELPTWPLPEFQLECASGVEDGVRRLTHQPCDAVVLVVSGPIPRAPEVCSRLEAACGPDAVPLVLVADGRDLRATESLALLPDGIARDAEGMIWVADAKGHGASRVAADGTVAEFVETGLSVYAVALGGNDRRELFLCCAPPAESWNRLGPPRSVLMRCRVDVPGA